MTRYSMTYDHIPKTLFDRFVNQNLIDHQKCERVDINGQTIEMEINVKNQNQNTGGFRQDAKNINEIFKFTCQRYHSYIS